MKSLRIVLRQASANYRREEAIDNKMTYPLPPISTVIGALHKACGYTDYHPMDVSIQGNYGSMHLRPYTDYCFLNSIMDDRGILVKMESNSGLSKAYTKVAAAKKSQGNSFKNGITIQVFREDLLNEYRELKQMDSKIDELKKGEWKEKIDSLKALSKSSKEAKQELKAYQMKIKEYEKQHYKEPISYYRSLTTSLKYYEILEDIFLILHIQSDDVTLNDIMSHRNQLTAIGRSEDFIQLEEMKLVELQETDPKEEVVSNYSAYVSCEDVRNGYLFTRTDSEAREIMGTKYLLNKNYSVIDGKRIFEKKRVLYTSHYSMEETKDNLYVDTYQDQKLIVNFL